MRIGGIGTYPTIAPPAANKPNEASGASKASFGETMKNAVGEVNNLQNDADQLTQKLATGDVEDVHQVMMALNKASTAFGLTVQVRNKAIEAYQDVMRMQV